MAMNMYELRTARFRGLWSIAVYALARRQVTIAACLSVFLLGVPLSGFAAICTPTSWSSIGPCSPSTGYGSSRESAAAACISIANASPAQVNSKIVVGGASFRADSNTWDAPVTVNGVNYPTTSGVASNTVPCTPPPVCVYPQVLNTAGDACVSRPLDQACKDNAVIHNSTHGPDLEEKYADGVVSSGPGCAPATPGQGFPPGSGCRVDYTVTGAARETPTSPWRSTYLVRYNGESCSTTPGLPDTLPPKEPDAPNQCGAGTMPGTATMGGTTVTLCTKPIDVKSEPKKEVKKENVGTPDETEVTKETSTECTGDLCTTTTTTTIKNSAGVTTSSKTDQEAVGKAQHCEKNAKDSVCGGQMASGCSKGTGSAGCVGLGTPQDGEIPTEEVDVGSFDPDNMSGFNIGQSCPPDLTFAMFGKTQRIEFKMLCDHADWIKPIVVLLASLTAMMIVYRAITGVNN